VKKCGIFKQPTGKKKNILKDIFDRHACINVNYHTNQKTIIIQIKRESKDARQDNSFQLDCSAYHERRHVAVQRTVCPCALHNSSLCAIEVGFS